VELAKQADAGDIRYTLDGGPAGPESQEFEAAFDVQQGTVLQAATFDGARLLARAPPLTIGAAALARRSGGDLKPCSGTLVLRLEDDAPLEGERALFNVDIIDPCWTWPDADLARGSSVRVAVGQLPFNFQIGRDADAIRRGDARTAAGELELRTGDCRGDPVAVIPLAVAAAHPGVSILGPATIPPQPGGGNLCLRFARPAIDPIWAIQWVEIGP
jgi:hexosaminidase